MTMLVRSNGSPEAVTLQSTPTNLPGRTAELAMPSLVRLAGTRVLIAAGLAFVLQLLICFAEFTDELYYASHYISVEADRLAGALRFRGGKVHVKPTGNTAHFRGKNSGAYAYRIMDGNGAVLASANLDLMRRASPMGSGSLGHLHDWTHKFDKSAWFHVAGGKQHRVAGRDLWIEVATLGDPDTQRLYGILKDAWKDVWAPVTPTILLMAAFSLFSIRGALNPLVQSAQLAESIVPGRHNVRFETSRLPKEAASFAEAINRLMERNQALIRSQERLVASTAHELRTPLAAMMLELGNISGEPARRLEQDVSGMSSAIDRLLVLARIESMAELKREPIDLAATGKAVAKNLAGLLEQRGNKLIIQSAEPHLVLGDLVSVREAIRNLVENASKHSPKGTTVKLTCGPGRCLTVEDSGNGLKAYDQNRLFDPFYRGATSSDGSGLGLAIVKQTMALHGGKIDVTRSELGGALFKLTFA